MAVAPVRMLATFPWSYASALLRVAVIASMASAAHSITAQQPARRGAPRDMDALKTRGGLASLPSPIWVQKRPVLVDVHFAVPRDLTRTDRPYNNGHIRTLETAGGDAGVAFTPGDAILTGAAGNSWPIGRAAFEATYAPAKGNRMGPDGKFFKKPLPVLGVQMKERFAVTASWGRLEGKPGDWLVQYDEGGRDFGIVDSKEFEQTYSRLTVSPDLRAKLDAMRARVPKH